MIRLSAIIVAVTLALLFQESVAYSCNRLRCEAKAPKACEAAAPTACAPAAPLPPACAQADCGTLVRKSAKTRCVQRPARLVERTVTRTVTK